MLSWQDEGMAIHSWQRELSWFPALAHLKEHLCYFCWRCQFFPRGAVCFAFSPWRTTCLLHTARQLWARPAWEIECPTGEAFQLGHSWESFLGPLASQRDCLGRSQISGLCRVSHGFADKLLISIMVSTWQSLQNTRWKVSKLFIQKMLIFKITVNRLVFKACHSAPLLMSFPRPGC